MKISEICRNVLMESENSTIILDMDETLIILTRELEKHSFDLVNRMEKQSNDLSKLEINDPSQDIISQERIKTAYKNYIHKNNVIFANLPSKYLRGTSIVVLRPHLKEFLHTLTSLPPNKAKGVVIHTGNSEGLLLIDLINKVCGTNIPGMKLKEQYHPDSLVVDDDINMAKIKLFVTGVEPERVQERTPDLKRWVKIPKFYGNLSDNALQTILPQIYQKL